MSAATNITDQRATSAEVLAASIRAALTAAAYELPADDVIAEAARRVAYWSDVDAALSAAEEAGLLLTPAYACMLFYRSALREAGHPDLISRRLLAWAQLADRRAAGHEVEGREFADKAEQRKRGLWQGAGDGEFEARSAAGFRCAARERAKAEALRRKARQIGRRAA